MASKTCCQGLVEFGNRIDNFFLFLIDFIQSGISLFSDQSPPPITFPALATDIFKFFFFN